MQTEGLPFVAYRLSSNVVYRRCISKFMLKKVFSWLIVLCLAIFVLSSFFVPLLNQNLMPYLIGTALVVGGLSSVGLIIVLIIERLKDRKEEKDDLSKY